MPGRLTLPGPPGHPGFPALTNSPTITSPALVTGVGVLLGTAAYMSPEQARGRVADKRADIWAFGVVLYEMLTATRAFTGDTVSDTLAAILTSTPDLSRVPPAVGRLLARCLEKDPSRRLRDIGDAMAWIGVAEAGDAPVAGRDKENSSRASTRPTLWIVATALTLLAAAAMAIALIRVPKQTVPPKSMRATIALPDGAAIQSFAIFA